MGSMAPESASSRQVQNTLAYRIQSANGGSDSWADSAREVRNSQPEYRPSTSNAWHTSAGGAHAWDRKWDYPLSHQIGQDCLDGLLRLQGTWPDEISRLIVPELTASSGISDLETIALDGVRRCHRHNGDQG